MTSMGAQAYSPSETTPSILMPWESVLTRSKPKVLVVVLSVVVFREMPTWVQVIGFCIAIAAIIVINLQKDTGRFDWSLIILLLLAGGIFLLVQRVITWHIPVAYIGTVAALTFLFPRYSGMPLESMLYELLAGGLILGAFFMATDYATSPVTPAGRLIFGVGCGLITVLIRYFGTYPEGVSFSILVMNLLVWYIDKATMPRRFGGKNNGK